MKKFIFWKLGHLKAEHVQPGKKGRLVSSVVSFWLPESAPFQKKIFITAKGDGELLFKGQKCLCFWEWRSHDSAVLCHWCCYEWADMALQARSAQRSSCSEGGRGLWPWPSEQGLARGRWLEFFLWTVQLADSLRGRTISGRRREIQDGQYYWSPRNAESDLEMGRGLHHAGEGNE